MLKVLVGSSVIALGLIAAAFVHRYELHSSFGSGRIYRLNRFTGHVQMCDVTLNQADVRRGRASDAHDWCLSALRLERPDTQQTNGLGP